MHVAKGWLIELQIGLESSLGGESQSNGPVENAIQRIQRQIRAFQLDKESCSSSRKRITELMKEDPKDKHRVEY